MIVLCNIYKDLKRVLWSNQITLKENIFFYLMYLFQELVINPAGPTAHCHDLSKITKDYVNNS
jgi:hypothetical protein